MVEFPIEPENILSDIHVPNYINTPDIAPPVFSYTVQLTLGDWSHDGHNQTDIIMIQSTLPADAVKEAFENGMKTVGLVVKDRHDTYLPFCDEYEDASIPDYIHDLLVEQGILVPAPELADVELPDSYDEVAYDYVGGIRIDEYDGQLSIDQDGYVRIWLEIAHAGNPAFEYKIISFAYDNVNIGGYGLFY